MLAPRLGRIALALAALTSAFSVASRAEAQAQEAPPSVDVNVDVEGEELPGKTRPIPADTRTGHLFIQPNVGLTAPAGSFSSDVGTGDLTSGGEFIGGIVGVGVGRNAVLEAQGSYAFLGAPTTCSICGRGSSYELGIGIRYHISQAFAFDPWVSYGAGYRLSAFDVAVQPGLEDRGTFRATYRGVDFARIAFGGDYYPTPKLGFGPYLAFDLGTNISRPRLPIEPAGDTNGARTYAFFELGFQISFDPFKTSLTTPPAKKSASR